MHLTTAGITIEVQLGPDECGSAIRRDVAAGLVAGPPELSPAWLCDLCQMARGRRVRPMGRRTYRNSFPAQARRAFAGVRLANPTEG
jgi:hypothetical protein